MSSLVLDIYSRSSLTKKEKLEEHFPTQHLSSPQSKLLKHPYRIGHSESHSPEGSTSALNANRNPVNNHEKKTDHQLQTPPGQLHFDVNKLQVHQDVLLPALLIRGRDWDRDAQKVICASSHWRQLEKRPRLHISCCALTQRAVQRGVIYKPVCEDKTMLILTCDWMWLSYQQEASLRRRREVPGFECRTGSRRHHLRPVAIHRSSPPQHSPSPCLLIGWLIILSQRQRPNLHVSLCKGNCDRVGGFCSPTRSPDLITVQLKKENQLFNFSQKVHQRNSLASWGDLVISFLGGK